MAQRCFPLSRFATNMLGCWPKNVLTFNVLLPICWAACPLSLSPFLFCHQGNGPLAQKCICLSRFATNVLGGWPNEAVNFLVLLPTCWTAGPRRFHFSCFLLPTCYAADPARLLSFLFCYQRVGPPAQAGFHLSRFATNVLGRWPKAAIIFQVLLPTRWAAGQKCFNL